jgi:hypothetical protein
MTGASDSDTLELALLLALAEAERLTLEDGEGLRLAEHEGLELADPDGDIDALGLGVAEGEADSLTPDAAAPIAKYVTQHSDESVSSITAVKPLASMDLMSISPTMASSTTCAYTALS